MPRQKMNADALQTDKWMLELEFYDEWADEWKWRNFDGLDVDLKKSIRRDGSLPLLRAIKVSAELWRRHGNNLRWRRVKGEDRVHVYDLARLAKHLKQLRRAAARGSTAVRA